MLSDDEFVVRAARAVLLERTYPGLLDLLNGHGPLPKFTGLADGGRPTFASPARYTAPPRAAASPTRSSACPSLRCGSILETASSRTWWTCAWRTMTA